MQQFVLRDFRTAPSSDVSKEEYWIGNEGPADVTWDGGMMVNHVRMSMLAVVGGALRFGFRFCGTHISKAIPFWKTVDVAMKPRHASTNP